MFADVMQMAAEAAFRCEKLKDEEGSEVHTAGSTRARQTHDARAGARRLRRAAAPSITLPDGRTVTMPQGMTPKKWREHVTTGVADAQAGKLTETQANATTFANRMEAAETNAKKFESAAQGFWDNTFRGITDAKYSPVPRGMTNWAVSKEYEQYEQAKSQFDHGHAASEVRRGDQP